MSVYCCMYRELACSCINKRGNLQNVECRKDFSASFHGVNVSMCVDFPLVCVSVRIMHDEPCVHGQHRGQQEARLQCVHSQLSSCDK